MEAPINDVRFGRERYGIRQISKSPQNCRDIFVEQLSNYFPKAQYDLAAYWCFGVEMLHQERKLEVGRARHCFPKFFILPRFIPFQIWGEGEGKSLCVGRVRHHHQKDPKTHHQPQKSTSGVKRSVKDPKLPFLPRTFLRSAAYHTVPNVRTK